MCVELYSPLSGSADGLHFYACISLEPCKLVHGSGKKAEGHDEWIEPAIVLPCLNESVQLQLPNCGANMCIHVYI